jgi:hypothetical protein
MVSNPSLRTEAVVAGCITAATLVHAAFSLMGEGLPPFVAYYPAILIAAALGGAGAATLVAILGACGWHFHRLILARERLCSHREST